MDILLSDDDDDDNSDDNDDDDDDEDHKYKHINQRLVQVAIYILTIGMSILLGLII